LGEKRKHEKGLLFRKTWGQRARKIRERRMKSACDLAKKRVRSRATKNATFNIKKWQAKYTRFWSINVRVSERRRPGKMFYGTRGKKRQENKDPTFKAKKK